LTASPPACNVSPEVITIIKSVVVADQTYSIGTTG
jgi:hypothetical protein